MGETLIAADTDILAERIDLVRRRIVAAAARSGRNPDAVTLIAVTKTIGTHAIRSALLAGITDVGENRVQEAVGKRSALSEAPRARLHLIGHLQRNKARQAVGLFDVVHSVDTVAIAETIDRLAAETGRTLEVFAQVNISGESAKSGFAPGALLDAAPLLAAFSHLRWRGLMTIPPLAAGTGEVRAVFGATRMLQQDLAQFFAPDPWDALSMGMSDDFEIAIEEGATHVRVGRAIFGDRA